MNEGRYDDVIRQVQDSAATDPAAVDEIKLLGIAHSQKKNYSLADSLLSTYLTNVPDDDQAMYYLALCADSLANDLKAIEWYRRYASATTNRTEGSAATERSAVLLRRRMQQDARRSIVNEASITPSSFDTSAVAVLAFENNGSNRDFDPLCRGLAEMVTTDLSKVRALKVVERLRLQTVFEELSLGETALVSSESAPRIGRLVGAHRVVKGSFASTDDGMIHLDAAVTKTADAEVEAFDSILGPTENIFRAEKDLVLHLLRELAIPLSSDEREAILTIPTENFFAFLRYAQGLEYEDQGLFAQASSSFKQALDLDPHYTDARDRLNYTESISPAGGSLGAAPKLPAVGGTGTIVPRSPVDGDAITTIIERAATTLTHTGGYAPTFPTPGKTNPVLIRQPLPEPVKPKK